MRRNLLLSLAALLVLIPSGIFFFHSGEIAGDADRIEQLSQPTKSAETITPEKREPSEGAEPKPVTPPKTPAVLLEEVFASMPSMEKGVRDMEVDALIVKLRAAGPAGLEAVRHFLASGRDLRLRDGYAFSGSRMVQAPTLRAAFIESLREWPGSTVVSLEILHSKASLWDAALAIRNLEKQNPGTYRHETIEALKQRISDPVSWDSTPGGEAILFEVSSHFRAEELLPQLHAMTAAQPIFYAPGYIQMLNAFPDEIRTAAIERMLAEPKVAETLLSYPHLTNQFSFVDERMRAFTANAFAHRWNASQKLNALQGLDPTPPSSSNTFFVDPRNPEYDRANAKRDKNETRARKVLLMEIEPSADTPELQQALKQVKQALTIRMGLLEADRRHEEDPPSEVKFASGDGKATIKGRRIENIEIRSAPVIPKIIDGEDSTAEQPR